MPLILEDLPEMWQRPSYELLMDILQHLEASPPIWNQKRPRANSLTGPRKADVTRYLSSIIKSPLAWVDDDDKRETLWELASKRMAERCGRTALGEMTRRWPFTGSVPFELVIKEPALTGDSLGFKTWASSYVLAQHLPRLATMSLATLFHNGQTPPAILELGSGTGLLGIAAAAQWRAPVYLSDLPHIVPNLRENVERNRDLVESFGGSVTAGALTWGGREDEVDQDLFGEKHRFQVVLVADPMYDDNHPGLVASAISENLTLGSESRAVVMVPLRDGTTIRLLQSFRKAIGMLETPLVLEVEDELVGQDDWVEDDEAGHVRCWLGIFSRSNLLSRASVEKLS